MKPPICDITDRNRPLYLHWPTGQKHLILESTEEGVVTITAFFGKSTTMNVNSWYGPIEMFWNQFRLAE